jgi:hypothetical protein
MPSENFIVISRKRTREEICPVDWAFACEIFYQNRMATVAIATI